MPTITTPYASGTITAVSGTSVTVSGGATAAWIGRCMRMQNGTAQGAIRRVTAVASATSITVDYAWTISPYAPYGFTEANPAAGNTFVVSHALDDIDDGATLIKDTNSNYFRLVAGQSLNMDGGSWLYDTSKTFEFDSNSIRCNGATGCFRFGDIDANGFVSNGCMLIETSPGTAGINNWAIAASGLTPTSPDMHVYGGTIIVRGVGSGNNQAAFWRLYRDATQIVRMDGVYVDGNFGARLMGSRSVAKGWRVYNNQSPLGALNPKSPFGKIDDIQVIASLQALYHFWTESLSAEAEGVIARGVTRLVRFAATAETGYVLELKDVDIPAVSALSALYQNDNPVGAPGNTLRLSQYLDVRLSNAAGALITTSARVVVRDVLGATVVDTTTTTGTIPRQTLRYRDMSIQGAGAFTWANAGGATYAPYAVAFAAYGFAPATLPLPLDASQVASMVALADSNVTLSAAAAAALSSKFAIDASGNITVAANATLDELYDYAAAWITQSAANLLVAGMGKMLIDGDGGNLVMTRNVTVNAGVVLSAGVKFKSFATTGTVGGAGTVTAVYTSSAGASAQLNLTGLTAGSSILVTDGAGAVIDYVAASGASYTRNIAPGATGAWRWRVARYGAQTATGTFSPGAGGVTSVAVALIPDTFVADSAANVAAYADLTSAQRIYDALALYGATQAGMLAGALATRGVGALTVPGGLTLDPAAASVLSVSGSAVTVKCSALAEDVTLISAAAINPGAAALGAAVKIRASNLDSEILTVNVTSVTLYPTAADRDAGTNPGPVIATGVLRYKFGATVSGVALSGAEYARVNIGGAVLFSDFTIAQGTTTLDVGVQGQLTAIQSSLSGITANTGLIPALL